MLKKSLVAAFILCFIPPLVSAYSLISTEVTYGVIEKVDPQNHAVYIAKPFGKTVKLSFSPIANIHYEGTKVAISDLHVGKKVKIKHTTYENGDKVLNGKIININHAEHRARLRLSATGVVEIKFRDTALVSGDVAEKSLNALRVGHIVTIKPPRRIAALR